VRHSDGSEYRQGIVFTPLIEAFSTLTKLREERMKERAAYQTLKWHCSALRRNIKNALGELLPDHPANAELLDLANIAASWPHGYNQYKSEQDLREHHDKLVRHSETAEQLRELFRNTSYRSASNDRLYIQDTTEETKVPCNVNVDKRAACEQAVTNFSNTKPDGFVNCLGKNYLAERDAHKNKFLNELSPWKIKALCSDEMRYYFDFHQGSRPAPIATDFLRSAIDRVTELGISVSAYRDAVEQMNTMGAALCILIIDRNRFHPVTPIKNPGGALRAMTRRHSQGKMNLVGSLIGLAERLKAEVS
jgi:replication initiation protein RepC